MRISKTIPSVLLSFIAWFSMLALLLIMAGVYVAARTGETKQADRGVKTSRNGDLIARGQYIVEGVAACGDCHTPRDENGISDRTRWLKGAPVFFQPAQAVPGWPLVAPRLAGLPPGSNAEIIALLTTGIWPQTEKPLRLPMPRFRMTRSDAEAVVAYLKSLNPGGGR